MGQPAEPAVWVGRAEQSGVLLESVRGAAAGRGGSVLVLGEPGMGRTALLSLAVREAARLGCLVLRSAADERGGELPLRAALDCLAEAGAAYQERRGGIVDLLSGTGTGGDGRTTAAMERLADLVAALCEDAPVVLVLDDAHRADGASLLLWQRLARTAPRLPLLLLLSAGVAMAAAPGTRVVRLGPLTGEESLRLAEAALGVPVGPRLAGWLGFADGNPRWLRELIDAGRAGGGIALADGTAELTTATGAQGPPPVAVPAVAERLDALSPGTRNALRMAALLGTEFTAAGLAAVLDRGPADLLRETDEALAAGLLADAGDRLRFRHELVRQALLASMPRSVRSALHLQAARTLAGAGAGQGPVAEQLLAAADALDGWGLRWLVENAEALAARAPATALPLLRRAVGLLSLDDPAREAPAERLGAVVCVLRCPDSAGLIRSLRESVTAPARRAALTFLLAENLLTTAGDAGPALEVIDEALAAATPVLAPWAERLRGLRALVLWHLESYETARVLAESVLDGDALAAGYGHHVLQLGLSRRHRYEEALVRAEQGLAGLGTAPEEAEIGFRLLAGKQFALARLNRSEGLRGAIGQARALARRTGNAVQLSAAAATAAVLDYWTGEWGSALTELAELERPDSTDPTDRPARPDTWALVLRHGLAALVHGHRDQREPVRAHLAAAERLGLLLPGPPGPPVAALTDPWGCLLMARALQCERQGRPREALASLLAELDEELPAGQPDIRFVRLAEVVRLALEAGDSAAALRAVTAAETGALPAADGTTPHPAGTASAVAARCRGLWERRPELIGEAVSHYERAGRPLLLGQALEDLAVAFAWRGDLDDARHSLNRAVDTYLPLGAAWDIVRADARLRSLGVRRGRRSTRRRSATGWAALTPTELTVARLVAEGLSNPEIATELFLSPRTVQTHVSHILAKLSLRSRTEVAREAARHGSPPWAAGRQTGWT